MKLNQCERVLDYIKFFGSIDQYQAMQDLGCMRLASRVSDLKRAGHSVRKRVKKVHNRYGEPIYVAEYYLEKEGENGGK